jgi:hypothetical protein
MANKDKPRANHKRPKAQRANDALTEKREKRRERKHKLVIIRRKATRGGYHIRKTP